MNQSDASRIINYASINNPTYGRADATSTFNMPDCPSIPAGIATTTGIGEYDGWKIESGTDYLIPAGETFNASCHLTATYYVAGTWNTKNGFWSVSEGATIYILPGGTLNVGSTLQPGLKIYNYGNLVSDGLTIADGVTIYSAVDITECEVFGVNDGGNLFSKGTISADEVRLNGNVIACAFIADKIDINSTGTIKASYFKAEELTMNTGYVVLDNNGLIEADFANITNGDTRITVDGTNAVFAAKRFSTNNLSWPKQIFAPEVAFDITDAYINNSEKKSLNDFEFQVSNDNRVAYVPTAGCHAAYPANTPEPTPDPEPQIVIEKITDIDPLDPDHDHGNISATCITFSGDKAYASYHLRGAGQKGCIEVIEDKGEALSLNSYMIAPDYDFNHLIVDSDTIITVGNHSEKGAFIGALPVGFDASEGVHSDFKVKELSTDEVITSVNNDGKDIIEGYKNAGDGNCVVRQGDYYYVTTYRGYGPIKRDFAKVKGAFTATTGSSKHIALGNGKMAVLSHDTYDETSSSATVNVYDASDYTFSETKASYAAGVISPVDGKNVVAIDGENIYACLSKGGLVRLNDGTEFHAGTNGNLPANGVAIDNNYIYLAMGSFVFVLDKTTMKEVTHYHAASGKSANYIALNNNKIYVAFGEDGIQVFTLKTK